MKRKDEKKVRTSRHVLVYVAILALAVGILAGCEEAGAGGGDDSTGDGGGSDTTTGDDGGDGTTGGDGESDSDTSLDLSAMILHLGFDGNLSDETGTSSAMTIYNDADGTSRTEAYGQDRHTDANGSIDFDGNYTMQVADIDLSSADSITVMAWALNDDGTQSEELRDIASYITSGPYYDFVLRLNGNQAFEAFVEDSGTNGADAADFFPLDNWVHVAIVYDNGDGELRIYQDGTLKNSVSVALDLSSGNLLVGGEDAKQREFHGRIDDLAIFTRALSDEEVALAKDQIGTN